MNTPLSSWQLLATLSATFANSYCYLYQDRVEDINSDFATFICMVGILIVLARIVVVTGQWQPLGSIA